MRLRIELASGNKMATRWVDILNTTPKDFYDVAEKKLKECFDELVPVVQKPVSDWPLPNAVNHITYAALLSDQIPVVPQMKEVKVTKKKPKGKRC